MPSKVIPITSHQHFRSLLSTNTFLIVDFYADWCGPCKIISPVFDSLAAQESKPGRIAFAKVNVDTQRDVAQTYGISAMPTFLVLRGSKTVETVRGANASALRSAILSAAAEANREPAKQGPSFSGKGQTLGAEGGAVGEGGVRAGGVGLPSLNLGNAWAGPVAMAQGTGLLATVVRFVGLYLTTLLSFDAVKAAEGSPFAVKRRR